MNILPKKRWHVRTKENIARVRRDEANAAKEEAEKERRVKLAEQEARTNALRARARSKYDGREDGAKEEIKEEVSFVTEGGHVNFFAELEAGLVSSTSTNKEHDEELKQEKEKYEKQIGYLTYLGQDTVEATGNVSWYNKTPGHAKKVQEKDEEVELKHKLHNDPINSYKEFCFSDVKVKPHSKSMSLKRKASPSEEDRKCTKKSKKEKKKRTKHRKRSRRQSNSSSEGSDSSEEDAHEKKSKLEKLRAERMRREEDEKKRSDKVMAKVYGVPYEDNEKSQPKPVMQQKYNSQFNPELARQNYRD